MKLPKKYFFVVVGVCATVGIVSSAIWANSSLPPIKRSKAVTLHIACVLAKPGPTLAFTLTNNSHFEVGVFDPEASPSRLVIITPDNKTFEEFVIADPAPGKYLPVVKPGETKIWKEDISDMFITTDKYTKPGVYKLRWKVTEWTPERERVGFESNEVLLLREKETPIIDPTTGRTPE